MHEASLLTSLLRHITAVAQTHQARKVVGVRLTLGALCHCSPAHLRQHFAHAARGTVADGAWLDIEVRTDSHEPQADAILLRSIEVEDS